MICGVYIIAVVMVEVTPLTPPQPNIDPSRVHHGHRGRVDRGGTEIGHGSLCSLLTALCLLLSAYCSLLSVKDVLKSRHILLTFVPFVAYTLNTPKSLKLNILIDKTIFQTGEFLRKCTHTRRCFLSMVS
jgi:hypothetical protein